MSSQLNEEEFELEFGYYPQYAPNGIIQKDLENKFSISLLETTGNSFTIDTRKYNNYDLKFLPTSLEEYIYNEKRYVRAKVNSYYDGCSFRLSNGIEYKDEDYVWIEVQPIKWKVYKQYDIMLSEILLFAGIQFKNKCNYRGDFGNTDIKQFMNNCFSKEFQPNYIHDDINNKNNEQVRSSFKRENPYNFNFDKVSEEEIIEGALKSNISVFLHGKPSDGKSARVKQLDPDCEIIYLATTIAESLIGKSVYNQATGEMIDVMPTWLKKIIKKCEDEPNKLHIIFFDEITNATPTIQKLAFNIILDKEVNGIWKLPQNARIVAAGNETTDSISANEISEPLFNRFAHVYINTTISSWLKWASTPKEQYERLDYEKQEEPRMLIHPAIYAYIAYKANGNHSVLRTPYNGKTPNADPRKWEMASKVLYKTGNPHMLRSLIGQDLTIDFIKFAKQSVITIEDVLNENYTEEDLKMNVSEKFATAVGLSSVDEDNLLVIRNFVMKLGRDIVATFDSLWTHGDEDRLQTIAELRIIEEEKGKSL
ncbi:MAG: ATP-binding protein [Clostridium sp.]|nr:ATP-binding protein [Clostridium sp.]MCM1443965.1 ATP-binding protein [Candidatus Amulumruptor caecigallinarius]